MQKGDIVDVYRRPYSKEDFEGKAKLIDKVSEDLAMEFWLVEFVGHEDEGHFERWIRK